MAAHNLEGGGYHHRLSFSCHRAQKAHRSCAFFLATAQDNPRSSKGPSKIYLHMGPEQKGTGQILFLSYMEAGHRDFLGVDKTGAPTFLYKGISEKQLGDAHQTL